MRVAHICDLYVAGTCHGSARYTRSSPNAALALAPLRGDGLVDPAVPVDDAHPCPTTGCSLD